MSRTLRIATLTGLLTLALLIQASAAFGLTMVRTYNGLTQEVISAPSGLAIYNLNRAGKVIEGEIIDYGKRTVTLIDGVGHRYQTISLAAAVARAVAQRTLLSHLSIEGKRVTTLRRERATMTGSSRLIHGVLARAWLIQTAKGETLREWYAEAATPPAAVAALLARVAPAGGASLAGQVALLVERRSGRHWVAVVSIKRLRQGVPAGGLRLPRGLHRGTVLPPVHRHGADIASTPATVSVPFGGGYVPVEQHQAVFTVFQGARFGSEPDVVRALNHAVQTVVEQHPYVDGLAQYGVQTGSFVGSAVHPRNPAAAIGDTSLQGFAAGLPIVGAARDHDGAPFNWTRFGPDPLVVVFVPAESVDAGNNNGYHSVVPIDTSWLDPLGFVQLPVYPYAIVKVPPPTDPNAIGETTATLSHETVEAATDPVGTGWMDPSKSALHEQGEIGDICHEGNHSPWSDITRISGVTVATYWSNADNACVPESRPTVTILSPANGATLAMAHGVGFSGRATDPFDGRLEGMALQWSDSVGGNFGNGENVGAVLQPGVHHITLTATDSQGLTRSATITITVVAHPPSALITEPADGSTFGTDQTITFQGSAHDPQDGALTGTELQWQILQGSTVIATPSSGVETSYDITSQGEYTVRLTATDAEGQSNSTSITVQIGPPSGNPSVAIDSPHNGDSLYSGSCTSTVDVSFQGHGTDPTDGTLSGGHLVWYLDYGTTNQVQIGTGTSFTYAVPQNCAFQANHTVTLIGTDSLGHSDIYQITITTGAPG